MYDPVMVQPMRDEVKEIGFKEVFTPEEVKSELSKSGTTVVQPEKQDPDYQQL